MKNPFVWFDNRSKNSIETAQYYSDLFGWNSQDGPRMKMLASENGLFAGIVEITSSITGWVPYIEVKDLDISVEKSITLGGTVIESKTKGPAGEYTIIKDPGGAHFAIWKKA